MPLNAEFFEVAEPLRVPSMGTEHVALMLYSLVMMLRPRSVLEIGAGYSTLFLGRALVDARNEARMDRALMAGGSPSHDRVPVLADSARRDYQPVLHVIDDLSHPRSSAARVDHALDRLGIADVVRKIDGDFRGASARLPRSATPLDFVWFDCGAAGAAGVPFFNEYWPLVREGGGLMALHSLLVPLRDPTSGQAKARVPSPLLHELRRHQADRGRGRTFELVNLAEPHKIVQGDVTLLSKVGALDFIPDATPGMPVPLQF